MYAIKCNNWPHFIEDNLWDIHTRVYNATGNEKIAADVYQTLHIIHPGTILKIHSFGQRIKIACYDAEKYYVNERFKIKKRHRVKTGDSATDQKINTAIAIALSAQAGCVTSEVLTALSVAFDNAIYPESSKDTECNRMIAALVRLAVYISDQICSSDDLPFSLYDYLNAVINCPSGCGNDILTSVKAGIRLEDSNIWDRLTQMVQENTVNVKRNNIPMQ